MTTNLELASSIDSYVAFGISRVADAGSVYNSLSRIQAARSAAVAPLPSPQADSASISGVSTLVAAAFNDSELRTERIASLRESISNGSYRVPSSAVAARIVDSLLAAG